MQGFATRLKINGELKPLEWSEAQRLMRTKFDDKNHWILVSHFAGIMMFLTIEHRFYSDEKSSGFQLVATIWNGEPFVVCAMRKESMTPADYAGAIRRLAGHDLTPGDLIEQDVNIAAPDWAMDDAVSLAAALLSKPGGELAVAA